ncbi:unnamed protein product [Symbiodinium microadriaticum]|nr:unnamed protein product [Symbiodinium microadriaticum]
MVDFIMTANYNMIYAMMAPLILSGLVCTHAAWTAEPTQLSWTWGLPLKSQAWWLKAILWIPMGLFQETVMDVYNSMAKIVDPTVTNNMFSKVNPLDAVAAAKGFYTFKDVVQASQR